MTPLELSIEGETKAIVTRHFAAPPDLVYRAHTEPALIRRWMTGPDGWEMTRCEHAADGRVRYDWADREGNGFHLTGEMQERDPPRRILHIERMHMPGPTPDNRVETLFGPDGEGGTRMTMAMTLPDAKTRAAMLATGMEHGMEASYGKLDALLVEVAA